MHRAYPGPRALVGACMNRHTHGFERNKTVYVPMNKYRWGLMVNDYMYLEEVARKAAKWGLDIVKGALWMSVVHASCGQGWGWGQG